MHHLFIKAIWVFITETESIKARQHFDLEIISL